MSLDFPDSPAVGDLYGSTDTVWRWDGEIWASTAGASGPRGVIAYAQVVGLAAVPAGWTMYATVNFNAVAGRRYKVSYRGGLNNDTAAQIAVIGIWQGPAFLRQVGGYLPANATPGESSWWSDFGVFTFAPGPVSISLGAYSASGGVYWSSDTGHPAEILVEDITYEAGTSGVGIQPTPWTNLTFLNGWTQYPGGMNGMYRKVGDIVYFRGYIVPPTPINTLAFTNMPVGFRQGDPSNEFVVSGWLPGSRTRPTISVNSNGDMVVNDGVNAAGAVSLSQVSYSTTS